MNPMIAGRVVRVFVAVMIVVAYSIGLFWLGTSVERRSLNNSLAGQNNALLKQNDEANTEFKERQRQNKALIEEILGLLRECRK